MSALRKIGGTSRATMSRMRLSRRALFCALLGLSGVACLSPTLPMPPPSPPDVEMVGQGQYRLSGSIPKSGMVLVLNGRTGIVNGEVAEPAYSFVVSAEPGDRMGIWYVTGQISSDSTWFRIPGTSTTVDAGNTSDASTSSDAGDAGGQ